MASGLQGDGRDIVADSLRGFTIILVVYAHVVYWFGSSGIILPRSTIAGGFIYVFHMPLMFMISGYVQGMKDYRASSWLHWLKKSAIDIYLPCMIFSLTQWAVMYFIFSRHNPANFGALQSTDLYMIPVRGFKEYWFLASLFFIKVIHSAFECSRCPGKLHALFWATVFIFPVLSGISLPAGIHYGLYFHCGYILRKHNYISRDKNPGVIAGLILLIAGAMLYFGPWAYGAANIFTRTGAAVCSCLGLFTLFYALEVKFSGLVIYGLYSMVIYCLHNWIVACFRMIFTISGMSSNSDPIMMFVITFAAAMAIPFCVIWLYRNVKLLRWTEYIFYPGRLIFRKKNPPARS